jgi:MFS family permease
VSLWIRLQLAESPVFQKMKDDGTTSKAPLTEAFGNWPNLKLVLNALLGAVAGQAVVWYTGQFYALFFLEKTMRVDGATANIMVAIALMIGTPFFIVFGWLSDRIGRKPIILAGCLLAAATYFPLFHMLSSSVNPALYEAQQRSPVLVIADPANCSVQFDPIGKNKFDRQSCDVVKSHLAKAGVSYANVAAPAGSVAQLSIGGMTLSAPDLRGMDDAARATAIKAFQVQSTAALKAAGFPEKADPARINKPLAIAILTILVLYVTMVYGPIAAFLVELFPARIRYTSMSLPYHIGNGWFGGFLPTIAFAIVAAKGDIYAGLWYPVIVALLTVVIGFLLLPESRHRDIAD